MNYSKEALEYVLREGRSRRAFTLVHDIVTTDVNRRLPFSSDSNGRIGSLLQVILRGLLDNSEKVLVFEYKWNGNDYEKYNIGSELYERMEKRINSVLIKSTEYKGALEMRRCEDLLTDLEWFWLGIPDWLRRRVMFVIPPSKSASLEALFGLMLGPVFEKKEKSNYFRVAKEISENNIVVGWGVEATDWFFPEALIDETLKKVTSTALPHPLYRA